MAKTIKITASSRGSGTSNYTAYTSTLHLGGGYRSLIQFDMSKIPAGATITSVVLHMSHSSSTYRATQSVVFKTSSSSSWSYSSTGSMTKTSVQVSGNHYSWDISSLGDKMLALGNSCNLHLSTSDSQDRPYDGTTSNVYIQVTYEENRTLFRYNGTTWEAVKLYRYDGSTWVEANIFRYDGTSWK